MNPKLILITVNVLNLLGKTIVDRINIIIKHNPIPPSMKIFAYEIKEI